MIKHTTKKPNIVKIQLIIIYVLILLITIMFTAISQRVKYENRIEELNTTHTQELTALREELQEKYESQITELKQYYEYGGDVAQIEREAEYIAKVIYGTARNHVDSDKKAVVWCILNRVEHYAHPDTIADSWQDFDSPEAYCDKIATKKLWHCTAPVHMILPCPLQRISVSSTTTPNSPAFSANAFRTTGSQ